MLPISVLCRQFGFAGLLYSLLLLAGCAAIGGAKSSGQNGQSGILLLGEVHDNPAGHRQRLALLQGRLDAGWRPAIVMEQFDREQQSALDAAMSQCATADCVIAAVVPQKSGWDWEHYRPVLALALHFQLPVLAGNVSRADTGRVLRGGLPAVLDASTLAAFGADRPLPADLLDSQRREIIAGHCNMLPESMVGGMVNAQIARDVWLAKVINEYAGRGVVLLAGNGHVRRDVGVGYWLQHVAAGTLHSVGFVEAGAHYPTGAFDELRILDPHPRADPCAGLVKRGGRGGE